MLSLRPDAPLTSVHAALVEARRATTEVQNAPNVGEGFVRWQLWATDQVRMLRGLIYEDDLNRLITTRLYWSLFGSNSNYLDNRALHATVQNEMVERQTALDAEIKAFDSDLANWGNGSALVVVPDTSVFIAMGGSFADADWHRLLVERPSVKIHVVVTMAAVVELDGKKLSRDNTAHGQQVRIGVRAALKRIEELFYRNSARFAYTTASGFHTNTVSLLTDDLAHVPLESADAEMIRRGLDLLPYAGRAKLVSYDLNQTFRARAAGLESTRIRYDYEDESRAEQSTPGT
jgi:PIN domain